MNYIVFSNMLYFSKMSDTEIDASFTGDDTLNDSVEDAELEAIKVGICNCHCRIVTDDHTK